MSQDGMPLGWMAVRVQTPYALQDKIDEIFKEFGFSVKIVSIDCFGTYYIIVLRDKYD